jgi:hypothetical protein
LVTDNRGTLQDRIGPYQILARLGSGGMATVYRALDPRDGRFIALKVLHDFRAEDGEYVRRFQQEAAVTTRLHHPNIVRVFEAGADNGQHYLAMELVEGETLQTRLQSRHRLQSSEVRDIAVAVATALDAAHRQKIIHRDVKPANILLGRDGSIRVSDFGIARALDSTTQTVTGTFLGSVAYASPEAIDGRADPRGDLYSLGVVLYQAILGHVPFEAASASAVMRMHERDVPPDLERLRTADAPLGKIVERLLAKDPDDRYQSAGHLLRALNADDGGGGGRGCLPRAAIGLGGLLSIAGAAAIAIVIWMLVTGDPDPGVSPDEAPEPTLSATPVHTATSTPGLATQTVVADATNAAATLTAVAALDVLGRGLQTATAHAATAQGLTGTPTSTPTATPVPVQALSAYTLPALGSRVAVQQKVDVLVFFTRGADIADMRVTVYIRQLSPGGSLTQLQASPVEVRQELGTARYQTTSPQNAVLCGFVVTVGSHAVERRCN